MLRAEAGANPSRIDSFLNRDDGDGSGDVPTRKLWRNDRAFPERAHKRQKYLATPEARALVLAFNGQTHFQNAIGLDSAFANVVDSYDRDP